MHIKVNLQDHSKYHTEQSTEIPIQVICCALKKRKKEKFKFTPLNREQDKAKYFFKL